ncbi:MAG: FAD-dependent oxidoreductase [Bacilli bacterium]|nr:FAD-dependent oxidoreductase [Bacilli bacterium]
MQEFDTIIIGSGIAGMTTAIYLRRENLNVLLIEKEMPGGQMVKAPHIENYPGYGKIEGANLAMHIYDQVTSLGPQMVYENVIDVEDFENQKIVKTESNIYKAKTVVIACGREARKLHLPLESKLIGHGISYCATCDGAFFKGKDVAVIGGGNSAVTEAIFLSNICRKVTIIYRSEELRSEASLREKAEAIPNIEILYHSTVTQLNEAEGKLVSVTLDDGKILDIEGLFVFIGYEPKATFLTNTNVETKNQYIVVDENMRTSHKGIYACGDSIQKEVYQLTTAAGEAAIAAHQIKKDLLI